MTERRPLPTPLQWILWPLAVVALLPTLDLLEFSFAAIAYPFQLDPIESKLLQQAVWLRLGEPIFFALGPEPPWVVGNYPPLYPLLSALGVSPEDPSFFWPRLLSLLSTLLAGGALVGLVRRLTDSLALGLIAVGLWWGTYEVYWYGALCRIDMLALALSTVGFAIGVSVKEWNWKRAVLVCAFFWGAWMTRQTQLLLPLALMVHLLIRDRKWGLKLGAMWALGCVLLFGVMLIFVGGVYWTLQVTANANESVPGQLDIWLRHFWRFQMVALIAALIGSVALLALGGKRLPISAPLLFALVFNWFNVMATAKVGADKNYLIEPIWCLCALLPVLFWELMQLDGKRTMALTASGVVGVMVALQVFLAITPEPGLKLGIVMDRGFWRMAPSARDEVRGQQILREVSDVDGLILTEYGMYAMLAGQDILWEPFLATQMAREGLWDESPLIAMVEDQLFGTILVEDDLTEEGVKRLSMSEEFAQAVRTHYRLERVWPGSITQRLWLPLEEN